jgi:hypothetical protein
VIYSLYILDSTCKTKHVPLQQRAWEMGNTFPQFCILTTTTFLFYSLSGGWSPTGSTRHGSHWLAYCSLPQVIMMENLVEWRLAGKTEVLGENPPQRHFVHHKSHLTRPRMKPGKPATNRLSYGTAKPLHYLFRIV